MFLSFFFKATHLLSAFAASNNHGEFCEKAKRGSGCFERNNETFAAVEIDHKTEKSVRQRNYTYIIVLLVVEFK